MRQFHLNPSFTTYTLALFAFLVITTKSIVKEKICASNGLYYKTMTIVNGNARIVNKLDASLSEDARVFIYDHHMFIVQATTVCISATFIFLVA